RDLQPDAFGRLQLVERCGRVADLLQIGECRAAVLARLKVLLDLGATDRSDRAVGQLLKRRDVTGARHVRLSFRLKAEATKARTLLRSHELYLEEGGFRLQAEDPRVNNARSRSRALWTCDFDVPSAIPSTCATSWCSSPSTSWSRNAARHPSGNCASARSRSSFVTARSPSRPLAVSAIVPVSSSASVNCPAR